MEGYQLVKQVQERYRGIAGKLSAITAKCEEWFASHGRESKTRNPNSSGNLSAVDHYMTYCRQYEAVETGAGEMLACRVHNSLMADFQADDPKREQCEMHSEFIIEAGDVLQWLAKHKLPDASDVQLRSFEAELGDIIDKAQEMQAQARAERIRRRAIENKTIALSAVASRRAR